MISKLRSGENITEKFLIKSIDVRKTKIGKDYLNITFQDKSATVNAKLWNVSEQMKDMFKAGDAVIVNAQVETFDGALQLKIASMDKTEISNEEMDNFVQSAPKNAKFMLDEIYKTIEDMKNNDIKTLTKTIIDKHSDKFISYPAAKTFHHAIKSGLLYHTYTMLSNAKMLSKTYSFINEDLLYAGVILHDVMKVEELECNKVYAVENYSNEGKLLGHIIQGVLEIGITARELNIESEVPLLLEHMLLAHHYYPEFGSPTYPMIPEGELLHHLDVMDAKMNQMEASFLSVNEGEFTGRVRSLESRFVYHYDLEDK